jgi:hypothetical protein
MLSSRMAFRTTKPKSELHSDPFLEKAYHYFTAEMHLMGARFSFESNSRRLLGLVRAAYASLPKHRFSAKAPHLRVRLLLRPQTVRSKRRGVEPPELGMGWLGAGSQGSDLVVLSPRERRALVVVSRQTLRSPYHARYELIEFAVFTLAARCQQLVSLHAACVGASGRGVLLMGGSGSGKSTVTMRSLMQGLDFLAEDSVFVAPGTLMATGIPNYLHVRADGLKWLHKAQQALVRASPVIRRRSGVRKFELDLRHGRRRLAARPLKIVAVVFLSARRAGSRRLLHALPKKLLLSRLASEQPYALGLPEWRTFSANIARLPGYELRRGAHPDESVTALRALLAGRLESPHA